MDSPTSEIIHVLEQIEREKGIPRKTVLEMIETALTNAFRKHLGKKQDFTAHVDPETGEITAVVHKKVVEKVTNSNTEISLEDAIRISPGAKLGGTVTVNADTTHIGRIAAQSAKQVIIQRIREIERENIYKEYKDKEKTVMTGVVSRIMRGTVILDMGKVDGLLPVREQMGVEHLAPGDRVRVYVLETEATSSGCRMIVSRTHPQLVRELFALEVPEIADGTVEIKHLVRDPGRRCKVTVASNNSRVDPVGACVGVKGVRVQSIIDELSGEKMDLIAWDNNPAKYVANALNPAKILHVSINRERKQAYVTVKQDQLSLAIGKSGQNVKLAARLTGWHIDIKSEEQRREEKQNSVKAFMGLPFVGTKTAHALVDAGLYSVADIATATIEQLSKIPGIGAKTAEKIIETARKTLPKTTSTDEIKQGGNSKRKNKSHESS